MTVFLVPLGAAKKQMFQQSASLHSGAGEKETLNANVAGKTGLVTLDPNVPSGAHSAASRLYCSAFIAFAVPLEIAKRLS